MYKDCKTPQSAQRQRHIVSCLVCMMQTQTFQEITVQDLCRKADVPRKSFYRYFECKEDVFTAAIDFLIFDFDPIIGFDPSTGFFKTTEYERFIAHEEIERIFLYWQRKQDFLYGVMRSDLYSVMMWRILHQMFNVSSDMALPRPGAASTGRTAAIYTVFGLFAVIVDWVGRGCVETASQMATQVMQLFPQSSAPDGP